MMIKKIEKKFICTDIELNGSCTGSGLDMSKYDVRIKPIPEDLSSHPKYYCPICAAMGCKHRVIKMISKPSCPICGVQLEWENVK